MSILPLTAQRRESLGIQQAGGVLIESVEQDSFAEQVGLRPNDLLLEINRKPVNSYEDVKKIQSTLKPGAAVQFRVMRKAGRNGAWQSLYASGFLPSNSKNQ
jgi:S1-C subfamily serine protease